MWGLVCLVSLPSAAEPWIDMDQDNGVVYFLFSSPARVERFDLSSGNFLASASLSGTPSAMAVDASGLYISFGQAVQRFNLNGTGGVHRLNSPATVQSLTLIDNFLIVQYNGDSFTSANKTTGAIIDSDSFFYEMVGLSVNTTLRRIFGRSAGVSPADIVQLDVNIDGTFGLQDDSVYHGDHDFASKTFTDASSTFVLDDSGTAYNSSDLLLAGSIAESIEHAVFIPGGFVVVRGDHYVAYDTNLLETGQYTPASNPAALAIDGTTVYGFRSITPSPGVAATSDDLTNFAPAAAPTPISGTGLNYSATAIESDGAGLIYLLASDEQMIFVWSSSVQGYVDTIPLRDSPQYMAYSQANNTIYLGYDTGKMTKVDLSAAYDEVPFANNPGNIIAIEAVDGFVFTSAQSTQDSNHYFRNYDATGALVDETDSGAEYSLEYVWDVNERRMYYLQDGSSPNDLNYMIINVNGTFGINGDSPYHGDFPFTHPIRVAPDGQTLVIGTGRIFDVNLDNTNFLSEDILDGLWFNGDLHTMHLEDTDSSRVQRWTGIAYAPDLSFVEIGTPRALFEVPEGLLLIRELGVTPQFTVLDSNLEKIFGPNAPLDWSWLLVCLAPLCVWGVYRSARKTLR